MWMWQSVIMISEQWCRQFRYLPAAQRFWFR
jgi:hypothetical protein